MTVLELSGVITPDHRAIIQCVLDYIEGWYEARPDRTERSIHSQLVKRQLALDARGGNRMHDMNGAMLVGYVRARVGTPPPARQQKSIKILGVFGDMAMVRAEMNDWIDFLHIARFANGWQIVNVLWAIKPTEEQQ